MDLKKRLKLTFYTMIIMPSCLTVVAFVVLWVVNTVIKNNLDMKDIGAHKFQPEFVRFLTSNMILVEMLIAIVIILIITSAFLTSWIKNGVFLHIKELSDGLNQIKNGNYDCALEPKGDGEIRSIYQNYEEMRLRLKDIATEKEHQEERNKELISNISHDLKTPITAIKGYSEGIIDGVADTPEKITKYVKTIYNKANDMDKLINELTVYSSIEHDHIPYNFRTLRVEDYFEDCRDELSMDLESQGISFAFESNLPSDTLVIADPEQLKKVINNIVSNSVKYMDKSEKCISMRILDNHDSVIVELEDNGKGISSKDLPRIFERFYRTDASRNSMKGGSGIGLSIVKKIIEDHGGYIYATSKEGQGTCMHFVLRKYVEP